MSEADLRAQAGSLERQLDFVNKCLAVSQDKLEASQKRYNELLLKYHDLANEKWATRREVQKEIISDMRREMPWLFDEG